MIIAPTRSELDEIRAQPLVSTLYTSRASNRFGAGDLAPIVRISQAKNWIRNLTGVLLYQDGLFLHYLEGAADDVEERMGRIRLDPRHSHISMIAEEPRARRLFPLWTMASASVTEAEKAVPGLRTIFAGPASSTDATAATDAVGRLAAWFADEQR